MGDRKRRDKATEAEYLGALAEEHVTGKFPEKFLLAIIRAYPCSSSDTDDQRLRCALKALFGKDYATNEKRSNLDEALRYMAWEYIRDRNGPGISLGKDPGAWLDGNPDGARSIKDLALEAADRVIDSPSAKHLENTFGKDRRQLCMCEVLGSDVPGSLHAQALADLARRLRPLGIKMCLEGDK